MLKPLPIVVFLICHEFLKSTSGRVQPEAGRSALPNGSNRGSNPDGAPWAYVGAPGVSIKRYLPGEGKGSV